MPAPPSAPILGPLLRASDCAKQSPDGFLNLLLNELPDHRYEVRRSRAWTLPRRSVLRVRAGMSMELESDSRMLPFVAGGVSLGYRSEPSGLPGGPGRERQAF